MCESRSDHPSGKLPVDWTNTYNKSRADAGRSDIECRTILLANPPMVEEW